MHAYNLFLEQLNKPNNRKERDTESKPDNVYDHNLTKQSFWTKLSLDQINELS